MNSRPILWVALAQACATLPPGVPPPAAEHLITPPESPPVDAAPLGHLLRGLYLLHGGFPSAAIPHLRLALVYAPDSAFLYEKLGRAWGEAGDEPKAREVLGAGLKAHPKDEWLNLLAGELASYDHQFVEAVQHLEVAARGDEALARAGPLLVDALLWSGHTATARTRVSEFLERRPSDPDFAEGLAADLEDHGVLDAALTTYHRARDQRPADRQAAFGEMRVLTLQGNPAAAADAIVPLFSHYPDDAQLYIVISRLLFRAGRSEAENYRAEALAQADGDPYSQSSVALADLFEGRVTQGLTLLREVAKLAPDELDVRLVLAETLLRHGDASGCLKALGDDAKPQLYRPRASCYAALWKIEPALEQLALALKNGAPVRDTLSDAARLLSQNVEQAPAQKLLATLLERAGSAVSSTEAKLASSSLADVYGQGEQAIRLLVEAVGESPTDPDLAMRLADLRARYGQLDDAVEALEALVRERPYDPVRLNALGFTLADAGKRLDEASVWLRRAYRLAPDEGFIIDSLGWLLFRQKRAAEALPLLMQASRVAPGDAEILRHVGDAYSAMGNRSAAAAAYQAAIDGRPAPVLRALIEGRLKHKP